MSEPKPKSMSGGPSQRSWRSGLGHPLTRLGMVVIAVIIVLDQITKAYMLQVLNLDEVLFIPISPLFNLTMVWNTGVSFGLLSAEADWGRWALIVLSLAISTLLFSWLLRAERRLSAVSFGLIIGGAIGNVIDRVRYGAVADFLDFSGLWFPYVFNIADAAITVGVILLILDGLRPVPSQPAEH